MTPGKTAAPLYRPAPVYRMSKHLASPQHSGLFLGTGRNALLGTTPGPPQMTPDDNPDKRVPGPTFIAQTTVSLPVTHPNTDSTLVIFLPNVTRRPTSKKYHLPAESTATVNFCHPNSLRPTVVYRERPGPPIQALVEKNRALERHIAELSKEYQAVKSVIDEGWAAHAAPGPAPPSGAVTTPASQPPRAHAGKDLEGALAS